MVDPSQRCSGCRKVFPIHLLKKGEFEIKKEEAITENLEIIQTVDNPLVLVSGYFCKKCFADVSEGETEKF